MIQAIQRSGSLGLLALVLVLPLAGCTKNPSEATPAAGTPPATPPGATNDGPAVARVPYARLEYGDDGTFTLDGKKFTGIAEEFHPDGTTLAKLYEYKDGAFHGTTREYYENGQISASTQWQNGQRHGANMYWNEEGKETKRQRYEHDVAVETVEPKNAGAPNP